MYNNMAESDLPSPSSTIIYFMLTTLCFAFFTIYNIFQTQDIDRVSHAVDNNIINSVYILLLVVGSYFINATISKAMCSQSIQWSYVLMITLLPWIIIFVSLYFILKLFPGWISPFSNTIGYIVIGFLGVDKIYDNIFKNEEEVDKNSELIKAIINMNSNRPNFINQISTVKDKFEEFFTGMNEVVKVDDPAYEKNKLKLYQLLVIKQVIGKIVWYVLAGILISSISYNLVISMACEKSLEEITSEFETARTSTDESSARRALRTTNRVLSRRS
jgi:hypothetical protein